MSLAIVHLSDIHIRHSTPEIEARFLGIATALETSDTLVTHVVILVSGDVAESGKKEEYEAAAKLFKNLISRITSLGNIRQVSLFAVPGNHDCDLSADQEIRDLIIEGELKNPSEILSEKKLRICLEPQANFFEFLQAFTTDGKLQLDYQIAPRNTVKVDGICIGFLGLNTALFTKRDEEQGKLVFLNRSLDTQHIPPCDLLICAIHHPVSWLTYECMDRLKSFAKARVDFLFSGHEHRPETYFKTADFDFGTVFCEAGVFSSERNRDRSTFSICLIDQAKDRYKLKTYEWRGAIYRMCDENSWNPIKTFKGRSGTRLPITPKFRSFINDPGAQYAHPRVEHLRLGDFLIPLTLKSLEKSSEVEAASFEIDSSTIERLIGSEGILLIFGSERYGKTTMAKVLFDESFNLRRVPLYVDLKDLKGFEQSDRLEIIEHAAKECYAIKHVEEYLQTKPQDRLLIVDNFGLASLTVEKQRELIETLRTNFPTIIILGNEVLKIQIASGASFLGAANPAGVFEIQELGYKAREKLIRKWCTAGTLIHEEDVALERRIHRCMETVETVLGKNLLPSSPFFVLVVLQLIEAETPVQTSNSGSYGFIYEYLITQALARSNQIKDINLKYSYLSELAYKLFQEKKVSFDETDLKLFHAEYVAAKKIECDQSRLIEDFVSAAILAQGDGFYVIKYRYLFYYFVARYISDRFHLQSVRDLAFSFVKQLHNENFFNVLVFLVYLVKDPALKDAIVSMASELFGDVEKFEFKEKNSRIISLGSMVDEIEFEEGQVAVAKERLYSEYGNLLADPKGQEDEGSDGVDDLVRINRAFKAIQLLGQTVKNFVGSMDGAEKIRFVEACYDLSLRAMSALIDMLRLSVPGLAQETYNRLLGESELRAARMRITPVISESAVYEDTRELVYRYAQMICMSVIKKVSFSIGSPELEPVYGEVTKAHPDHSYEILTTAIKLDHFRNVPINDLKKLSVIVSEDPFIGGVIRRLVLLHFYLFPVRDSLRAEICHDMEISYKKTHQLAHGSKKSITK